MSRGSRCIRNNISRWNRAFAGSSSPPWGALGSWRRWRPALGSRGWGCCPGRWRRCRANPPWWKRLCPRPGGEQACPRYRHRVPGSPQSAEGDGRFEPLTAVVTGRPAPGRHVGRRALAQASGATAGRRPWSKPRAPGPVSRHARQASHDVWSGWPCGHAIGARAAAPALGALGRERLRAAPGRGPPPGGSSGMAGGQRSSPKQP